jgi:hypothetical protein
MSDDGSPLAHGRGDTRNRMRKAADRQKRYRSHRLDQAEIRRFHAMMLMDRAAPDDRERARTLLSESLESYKRFGMARHGEMVGALLDSGRAQG